MSWNPFTRSNLFSRKKHNEVANIVGALAKLKVVRGGKDHLHLSSDNAVLELKKEALSQSVAVEASLCDPATGEVKNYRLYGEEVA